MTYFFICLFLFYRYVTPPDLHSFPTRRSSDLPTSPTTSVAATWQPSRMSSQVLDARMPSLSSFLPTAKPWTPDRKSTRLNSSHANISYAVFCLKKKRRAYGGWTSLDLYALLYL